VSTWRLLADEPACTELVLLIFDDGDGSCGADSDITLLRTSGDGVISPPCVGRRAGGVRLRSWGNVDEESSATDSRDLADGGGMLSSAAISGEGSLAVLLQQPMGMGKESGMISDYSTNRLDIGEKDT